MDAKALKRIPQSEWESARYHNALARPCDECGEEAMPSGMKHTHTGGGHRAWVCEACYAKHPPEPPPETVPEHDPKVKLTGEWRVPTKHDRAWLPPNGRVVCTWADDCSPSSTSGGRRWILELAEPAEVWPQ